MTATVIPLRRPVAPVVTATPGWRPCPLPWCGGRCTGGDTYDHRFIADRVHTTVLAAVDGTDPADGGDIPVTVTVTASEDYEIGVYTGTDIVLTVAGVAVVLGPARSAQIRAALAAAEQHAAPAPAVQVAS